MAPTADPAFVWRMEDALDVYEQPLDPARPVVCLDETSRQLLGEARPPLPPAPGRAARHDPEYVRGMQALGYTGLSLDALVGARDHGVDPEYTRAMGELGYKGVPLDSLIRMRDHGVDPAYVRRLQQRGVSNLSVDELIRRRDRGDDK